MGGILVVWIITAIVAAIVASNKGRSGAGWFFLCLLLTPLAILVLLALPTLKPSEPQAVRVIEPSGEATKTCPQCAETVKAAARICRFCRYEFSADPPPAAHTGDISQSVGPATSKVKEAAREVARLAALSQAEYDRERVGAAARLGYSSVKFLDRVVEVTRGSANAGDDRG